MDAMTRKLKPICPMCNDVHAKQNYSHFLNGKSLWVRGEGRTPFEGWYILMYCPNENEHFSKLYSPNYKYIGWVADDEIPF